mgnify:CR=1 FL=1
MRESRTIMAISVMVMIVPLCVVCTFVDGNRRPMETPDNSQNQVACDSTCVMGFVTECIGVREDVLAAAKTQVERLFDIGRTDYPDHSYTSWLIENLTYAYTCDDLGGMRLAIYQMNCEFLKFRQDGDKTGYLQSLVENDCTPGTGHVLSSGVNCRCDSPRIQTSESPLTS